VSPPLVAHVASPGDGRRVAGAANPTPLAVGAVSPAAEACSANPTAVAANPTAVAGGSPEPVWATEWSPC